LTEAADQGRITKNEAMARAAEGEGEAQANTRVEPRPAARTLKGRP